MIKKLIEQKRQNRILKIKDAIDKHTSTDIDTKKINGIVEAAQEIEKTTKKENRKARIKKYAILAGVILLSIPLAKICPLCATEIINALPIILKAMLTL